ncbi:hypothetical protein [Vacuolonema iberomarrocanum]|uniref:hypothetical protein n=1 Tax=Vacuolonema iberomarrocanum TaxID=3454632 RepID=UPI0019E97CB8|nr:hypothetical protein [filamentous cyanobacterium LEGE 07170]
MAVFFCGDRLGGAEFRGIEGNGHKLKLRGRSPHHSPRLPLTPYRLIHLFTYSSTHLPPFRREKGKRAKGKRDTCGRLKTPRGNTDDSEANIVVGVVGRIVVAIGGATIPRIVDPGTTVFTDQSHRQSKAASLKTNPIPGKSSSFWVPVAAHTPARQRSVGAVAGLEPPSIS